MNASLKRQPLRIVYAAGPGDVARTYGYWLRTLDDPTQVAMTCSGMFYDLARAAGDEVYVISSCARPVSIADGSWRIEHRPIRFLQSGGVLYHLGQIWSGLRIVASAIRFRADVVVAVEGTTHWFTLGLLRPFGIEAIPSLHCVLWPKFGRRKPNVFGRAIELLNKRFFTAARTGILTMSADIAAQVRQLTDFAARGVISFLPTYRAEAFDGIEPCDVHAKPFRVLFAGRIERNKGVFDLLDIATRFAAEDRTEIEFDLCGEGSELGALKAAAIDAGVDDRFRCHGHRERAVMKQMYGQSHVVVVPTRTDFVEGFNQVIAEAILAGRPVISSAVCPALDYVQDAAIEVPPNDTKAYGDAILSLADSRDLLASKVAACGASRGQFLDLDNAWNAKLAIALDGVRRERVAAPSTEASLVASRTT